ncbi:VOC family protein [Natrarchaeobius chitinivorans]|uniref:Glyoxalase n=1 Tax=Natrarchaeobius chitinivorans TaxID=1679083 RepID=A0A3N6M4W2_NATCH|nr:VOC family protein [Natrarchaeobius chitinivorans]RQG91040.1 glyoxalase [Natrarchaeobius chitinivorans]
MSDDHADPDHGGEIHHLEISASDLEAAVDFWGWLLTELGYRPKESFEGGRSWINGPTYVVVQRSDHPDRPFVRRAPGMDHVAFHASSREQVDTITEGVRNRTDATVLYEDRHPYAGGYYALYCEGPDDVVVEIVGPEE